jgi:NAD(P)-dependent dehydrogenase (short-subunit alcohol dehydrogenase family)
MTDKPLAGKIAIVTGGGRGMGRAMARAFAVAGAQGVCVTSGASLGEIREVADEIDDLAGRKGTGLAITADVRERAACAHAVEQAARTFGALHILVNNAGLGMKNVGASRGAFWDCNPDGWEKLIAVNVNGPFHMARVAAPHLIKAGWGRIINVSKSADTMHSAHNAPYGPSKAALEAMTICWAQDLLGTGVTSNAILPGGLTNTTFSRSTAVPRAREQGKVVYEPKDIAPLAVALASGASDTYSGCRFNARGWRDDLSPTEALEACRTVAVFPKPRRARELMTCWQPVADHD